MDRRNSISFTHSGGSGFIAGLRALDGISPGLSTKFRKQGCDVKAITSIIRTPGEEKLTRYPTQPGRTVMIPWKSAHQVLADQLKPQVLHYRHAFTTYKASEVISLPLFPRVRALSLLLAIIN